MVGTRKTLHSLIALSHRLYNVSKRKSCHIQRIKDIQQEGILQDCLAYYLVDYNLSGEARTKVSYEDMVVYINPKFKDQAINALVNGFILRDSLRLPSFTDYFFRQLDEKYVFEMTRSDETKLDPVEIYGMRKLLIKIEHTALSSLNKHYSRHTNVSRLLPIEGSIYPYSSFHQEARRHLQSEGCAEIKNGVQEITQKLLGGRQGIVLPHLLNNSLVFLMQKGVGSTMLIPAKTWSDGSKQESSGGLMIFYPDGRRITEEEEGLLIAVSSSWFRQNTANDLVKKVAKGKEKLELIQKIWVWLFYDDLENSFQQFVSNSIYSIVPTLLP